MVAVAYQMPVHAATAGSESRTGAGSCTLSVVLPELRSKVQFQPYSAGCETRVVRLDPNVIVAIMTPLARTVPRMAGATVTRSRSALGPNASRMPSATGTGRPIACAALTARTPSGRDGRNAAAGDDKGGAGHDGDDHRDAAAEHGPVERHARGWVDRPDRAQRRERGEGDRDGRGKQRAEED